MDGGERGEVVDARVDGDEIIYTAEHPNGDEIRGVLSRRVNLHTALSDGAMEDVAEQLIGTTIEWPAQNSR